MDAENENPNPVETPVIEVLDKEKDGNIQLIDMSDDDVFRLTQSARYALVQEMTKHGKPPTDFERGTLFLSTLDSMDKQVINRAKLHIEDEKAKSDDQFRAIMVQILNDNGMRNASIANGYSPEQATGEFTLPEELRNIELVPGQTDVAPPQIEYADIMDAQNKDSQSS